MSFQYRVWQLLHDGEDSAARLAHKHRLPFRKVSEAFRCLRRRKAIEFVAKTGKECVYRLTGVSLLVDGRGHSPGSKAGLKMGPLWRRGIKRLSKESERRDDVPRRSGYGSGLTALEMFWQGSNRMSKGNQ